MFERFSGEARTVVHHAWDESRRLRHGHVGTEHLLLGLLAPDAGAAAALLRTAGVDADRVRAGINRHVGSPPRILSDADAEALRTVGIDVEAVLARIEASFGPHAVLETEPGRGGGWRALRRGRRPGRTRLTPRARKVIELSLREALRLHSDAIGAEHLLLALLREGGGLGVRVLSEAGVDLERLRRETTSALRRAA